MERYPNDNESNQAYNDPYDPHQSQQPYSNYPPYPPYIPPRTNGKSIVSLVLGILSIVIPYIGFLIGIVAIVFASMSFKEIRLRQEQGRGMAVAGLVTGIIGTALYGLLLLFIVLALAIFSGQEVNNYIYY
ncbi:hypothetical protein PA598K_04402 [Paenibacillus sp. 598K]|uniref:DUF4190 domain-containing protein n=1 Tax=Paenibacillus sp. 598K TaxID=1117987 RepID=UPI000FF93B5B|nr:DUF4190 domain-containing protein [Paenibacillus sp. 598K]GBF75965.1 hypothetical protein PA598K_04402 [Paenibacillus sp. 598K]